MKNISRLFKSLSFIFLLTTLVASCDEKDGGTIWYDLELSDYLYSFNASGGEVTIDIATSYPQGWDVRSESSGEWLTEKNRTRNSITYEASANEGSINRVAEITVNAGTISRTIKFDQAYDRSRHKTGIYIFDDTDTYQLAISTTGKYILTGKNVTQGNQAAMELYLFDTDTFESTFVITTTEPITGIAEVTDSGTIFASVRYDGKPDDIIIKDGQIERPICPSGYHSPGFRAANADGSVVVGFCFKTGDGTVTKPVRWTNGVPEVLKYPDTNRSNGYINYGGAQARAVTPDGKYTFGRSGNLFDGIYWEAGSTEWHWMGEMETGTTIIDSYSGEEEQVNVYNFINIGGDTKTSPNGRYMAVSYYGPGRGFEGERVQYSSYPAVWDLEKMELAAHLYEYTTDKDGNQVPQSERGEVLSVGDDARLFYIADPLFKRYYSMWYDGVVGSPDDFVNQMFGSYVGRGIHVKMFRESPMLLIGTFSTDGAEPMFIITEEMINGNNIPN